MRELRSLLIAGSLAFGLALSVDNARAQGYDSALEWNKTLEAAKKEGRVVISIPASAELRKEVDKVFKQRFGIETEDQYPRLENQSEEKVVKVREPAAEFARKLLD
ncbi:MAG: hypothetical protein ACRD2L_24255 [Terriglobia bacterium]